MAWDGLWALPRTCLCWCLVSRCSALSYTSLHSTGSSQFVSITAFGNGGEAPGAGLWNSCLRSQGLQASSHLFTGKVWSETSERCSSLRPLSYLSPDKWVICGEGCLDLSPSSVVLPWTLTVPLLRSCLCSPLLNSWVCGFTTVAHPAKSSQTRKQECSNISSEWELLWLRKGMIEYESNMYDT